MIGLKQDVLFESRRLDLVVLDEHVLADGLDSVLLPCGRQEGQVHASKCTLTELHLDVEILERYIGSCGALTSHG